jgi:hypothetical protein
MLFKLGHYPFRNQFTFRFRCARICSLLTGIPACRVGNIYIHLMQSSNRFNRARFYRGHFHLFLLVSGLFGIFTVRFCGASTVETNSRAEVSFMASLWESDSIAISSLANAQYPQFSTDWQYIFPHANLAADGDIHNDMGVDATGYGTTNNNSGESPIIVEVVNATSSQLNNLHSLNAARVRPRGIFRLYTEHTGERHFELHPATGLDVWNGSAFVSSNDYHANIAFVADGTTHPNSTLTNVLNGSQTMTATIAANNLNVVFTYPSPSVNYVQYNGTTMSALANDGVSSYFLLRPDLAPQVVVRCRIVSGTVAATVAANIVSNQTVTVNALTRTDMLAVSNRIASMTANQTATFGRPVELIILGLTTSSQPPSITAQPQNLTVNPGQNAVFNVTAIGAAPLSYQWQSNGVAIPSGTNSSLLLTNVQVNFAANYSVTVTNAFGSATSSNASLLVVAGGGGSGSVVAQWNFNSTPPDASTTTGSTLTSIGSGTLSNLGTTATFATGSTNDPSVDNTGWNTTGYPSQGTGNKTDGIQASVSTAGFANIAVGWDQRVSGTASKYFRLQYTTNGINFVDGPLITMQNNSVFETKSNYLGAISGADNNPNFGFRIVSETEGSAINNGNTNYVTTSTSGYGSSGTVRFDLLTVYGIAMPTISAQPISVVAVVGDNVDFDVTAAGAAPLGYQWQFSGTNLPAATNSILSLTNITIDEAGTYQVVVTNSAGSMTSSIAQLTIYPTAAATLSAPVFAIGQFQFTVTGVPDFTYAVETSTNLIDWTSVETNTSPFVITDTNVFDAPTHFYRAVFLPGVDAGD